MDKKQTIKLLGGTIARGLMWVTAALSASYGLPIEMKTDTADALGGWIAAVALAVVASLWSNEKDKKLKDS